MIDHDPDHGGHDHHPAHDHHDHHAGDDHHDHHDDHHDHGHGEAHHDEPDRHPLDDVAHDQHPPTDARAHGAPDPTHGLVDLHGQLIEGLVVDPHTGWLAPDPLHDGLGGTATVSAEEHAVVHQVLAASDPPVTEEARQAILDAIFGPT